MEVSGPFQESPPGLTLFFSGRTDPRVEEWPLMQSPIPTVGLCFAYVYLVKWAGPCLMKNRQPFDIRALMVIYNFAMVWLSLYLFLKLGWLGWFGTYNYKCQPVDYSASESAIEVSVPVSP